MTFVIIFGPPAVGKMTVAYELAQTTGLRVFHNHMTIDLVLNFLDFGQPQYSKLVTEFCKRIFEEVAASELPGLIFTYVWALDQPSDKAFIDECADIFVSQGGHVYYVELAAPQAERLRRNGLAFRLAHKPLKRNRQESHRHLREADRTYKLNSEGDFFYTDNYLKIDNTHLSAADAAERISRKFQLIRVVEPPAS